jgi:hypothetical protein
MRNIVLTSMALLLASCTNLPDAGTTSVVPIVRIVEAVRCEVMAAFSAGTPDPASLALWPALLTITTKIDSNATVQPGVSLAAGKSAKLAWKAPGASVKNENGIARESVIEYTIRALDQAGQGMACEHPGAPAIAQGLDLREWLQQTASGMPPLSSDLAIKKVAYKKTYKVTANASGGLSFTIDDLTLSLEGNSLGQTNSYEINVQLKEPPKAMLANAGAAVPAAFIQELRDQRDEDADKETTITVAPGQSIIIQ